MFSGAQKLALLVFDRANEIVMVTYMVVKIRWDDASVTFGWMSVTPNMPNWVSSLGAFYMSIV